MPFSGVLVFNYHRVADSINLEFDRGLWSTDAQTFRDQVRFCKSHLEMITPDVLPQVTASGRGRYGMITFDDGYRDNFDIAFPILKAEGVPATFFVTTGFVDSPKIPWWDEIAWMVRMSRRECVRLPGWLPSPVLFDEPDREQLVRTLLRKYRSLPPESYERYLDAVAEATKSGRCSGSMGNNLWMTWEMLREMRAAGMVIGGHSVTHPVLATGTYAGQRNEIIGCASRLAEELSEPMRHFSYPVGGPEEFDSITRDCLREANVEYAFSYYGGLNCFNRWDNYNIRRVAIEREITADWFKAIVSMPKLLA